MRLGLIIACSLTFFLPAITSTQQSLDTDIFKHFWSIAEVLHQVQEKSFRTIDAGKIIEEGLKAMVSKIDAHSSFFTPKSYQATVDQAAGQFPGVGISMISKPVEEDSLLIVDVIRSGPADLAGIQGGDKIVEVNNTKLRGLSSDEVITLLRGPLDTVVNIKIIREKKPLEFSLTRKIIKDKSVLCYFLPEQKVTYIALKTFSEKTASTIRELLVTAQERESRSIILDLRKNTGGVFEASIETASLFLPDKSLVVSTKNNRQVVVQRYHTHGTPIHKAHIPLFILTNNFTASSSEVLTGCLQYHAKHSYNLPIFVVGTSTFGKGSVQEIMALSTGCAIKITSMLYYLPGDTCLQAKGITPDFLVMPKAIPHTELKWIEDLIGKEASLVGHITEQEVSGEKPQDTPPTPPVAIEKKELSPEQLEQAYQKALTEDHQINFCLTLSNLYSFARTYAPEELASYQRTYQFLSQNIVQDKPYKVEPIRI